MQRVAGYARLLGVVPCDNLSQVAIGGRQESHLRHFAALLPSSAYFLDRLKSNVKRLSIRLTQLPTFSSDE